MNFNQTVKYNLKRVLPILGIAGATLLPACKKDKEKEPEIQKHDVEIEFAQYHYELLAPDTIAERLSHPDVRNVYMVPSNDDFTNVSSKYAGIVIDAVLQPAVNVAPDRVFGRGNLRFTPGVILEKDSLWLVQHGWTINKQNQR